jgi:hypothetical protein
MFRSFLLSDPDVTRDGRLRRVLLEIHHHDDRYVLLEVASATGNRLLRFSSKDRKLTYAAFAQELDHLTE